MTYQWDTAVSKEVDLQKSNLIFPWSVLHTKNIKQQNPI